MVNIAGAWLPDGGHHHGHARLRARVTTTITAGPNDIATASRTVRLEVFEDGLPPCFRLRAQSRPALTAQAASVKTIRPDGTKQIFVMRDKATFWINPR